ncbi:RGG repeats nuclear RNA binding protein A [Neltuma alba]|uniref:RGG repeats nuclear RNA binding protein A n=1 Tax=Neltuma alba TaxID=207710 RepID=UPI0010A39B99|nr:RGG repeats nuclear RNA binding protein A-like [Prosopis alba]
MATLNPFDLLGDDAEDPLQLIAAEEQKVVSAPKKAPGQDHGKPGVRALAQQNKPAQLPTKPPPPSQAVREARNETPRGGRGGVRGGGSGYGRGRGGRGFNRDFSNDENSFSGSGGLAGQGALVDGETGKPVERHGYGGPRGSFRGGRRGGFSNGEGGEEGRPRRAFDRRSGTGRGNEFKREGAGRGNWGTPDDELVQATEEVVNDSEKNLSDEKPAEENVGDDNKESPANGDEEKEPEDKEMTLEEYEKVLEEKRKALQALKTEERKVDTKDFESMQQLSSKKDNDDVFIKLGSEKDKRKEAFEKEEKSKKSVSINEFLKPAEGERYYNPGGRGRGRGRGSRGHGGNMSHNVQAPLIQDPGQFPTLGAK